MVAIALSLPNGSTNVTTYNLLNGETRNLSSDVVVNLDQRRDPDSFFQFGRSIMIKRWEILRKVVEGSDMFNLPKYPTQRCKFTGEVAKSHTGFAWLESNEGTDLKSVFREHKIVTRGGARFRCDDKWVGVSLLCKDPEFELFMETLSTICDKLTRSNGKRI